MKSWTRSQKIMLLGIVLLIMISLAFIWYGFNVPIKSFGTKDSCPMENPKTYIYHLMSGQGSEFEDLNKNNQQLPNLGPAEGCRVLEVHELYLF